MKVRFVYDVAQNHDKVSFEFKRDNKWYDDASDGCHRKPYVKIGDDDRTRQFTCDFNCPY